MVKRKKPPRVSKEEVDIEPLPIPGRDDLNTPPQNLTDYWACYYGPKSVGKTTLISEFEDYITLMAETRRNDLSIRMQELAVMTAAQIMEDPRLDPWLRFQDWAMRIATKQKARGINIDTIDKVYVMARNSVSARYGVDNPSKLKKESSAAWIELRNEFEGFFNQLRYTGLSVNFVSHTKERDMDVVEDGDAMSQVGPSAAPACVEFIKSVCSYAFYYGWDGGERVIVCRDYKNAIWWGCGPSGHFLQPDGREIKRFRMPSKPGKGYETLVKGFNNELWDINTPEEKRVVKKKGPPSTKKRK